MKLDFRIEWGYSYLYSRRHYHPVYNWDGRLECNGGTIYNVYKLDYPVIWYGPGHCAVETKLDTPCWKSSTKRGISGIRIEAEANDKAIFTLKTNSGTFIIPVELLLREKRVIFNVGPKYLGCHVWATMTGHLWFRPAPKPGQTVFEAKDLALPQRDWARMHTGEIKPGEALVFQADIPAPKKDFSETLFHIQAMAAPAEHTPGAEKQVYDYFDFELLCDGKSVKTFRKYLNLHDDFLQQLDDIWVRAQIAPGRHTFAIRNLHKELCVLVSRLVLQQSERNHGQLSIPEWTILNEHVVGKVFAVKPDTFDIELPEETLHLEVKPGWNEFDFVSSTPGAVQCRCIGKDTVTVYVYDVQEESNPIKVGFDMTAVPADETGFMDWILDYTARTRLGNFANFRSFIYNPDRELPRLPIPGRLMRKWGEFCRKHYIYAEATTDFDDGELIAGAKEFFHGAGKHEHTCYVYGLDPEPPFESNDMKEAMEHFLDWIKPQIDRAHNVGAQMAFGDASGAIRYTFLAGVDYVRAETMVAHTQHLLSQARPAAESLGKGEWGVHIAIHHPYQPFFETHLRQFYLSLMQPWMMGANILYEEDSLFITWKEERCTWDDVITKGKRDMLRGFFKFAKTNPRVGKCVRKIAFIEGRYAAPFNGFICGCEQTPDYAVWGAFGKSSPEWGHRQPEKCRQILDVLMPGASTQPLRQRFDKRRFFFSGTPYGDFDEAPIEAGATYLSNYSLLANLGWNTMIEEDYSKLLDYVRQGGTLLIGIPQFSMHLKREFLRDMDDLALWNNGDLREFCGFTVRGKGVEYCGQWNCAGRENYAEPELSAMPSKSSEEDGPALLADIELAGAEIVVWDAASGAPMLVRHKVGKGLVYCLTLWAYPGHEKYQRFSACVLEKLAADNRPDIYVEDSSKEVFWTLWRQDDGGSCLMLLNTDWTTKGNEKPVTVHTPNGAFQLSVCEGAALLVTIATDGSWTTKECVF